MSNILEEVIKKDPELPGANAQVVSVIDQIKAQNEMLATMDPASDPNHPGHTYGWIQKPTSGAFPTGQFLGFDVPPGVQNFIQDNLLTPIGAASAVGSKVLTKALAKEKTKRQVAKSIKRHKNKPVEDFESRKISREYDKDAKDDYESYMFGESFDDQMLPPGVHDWKSMAKYDKDVVRYSKNFDKYRKSFEEAREEFMEGMHIQGLNEEEFMMQLADFEAIYDPSSPSFDPKALLDLKRSTKTKKVASNITRQF